MERLLSIISAVLIIGLLLALLAFLFLGNGAKARGAAMLNQIATGSQAHQTEYGHRPKTIDELLGKSPRKIMFLTLPSHYSTTDYRVISPPPGGDAFIIEWLGPDGAFGTGDELQMIHDDTGVTIGPP